MADFFRDVVFHCISPLDWNNTMFEARFENIKQKLTYFGTFVKHFIWDSIKLGAEALCLVPKRSRKPLNSRNFAGKGIVVGKFLERN